MHSAVGAPIPPPASAPPTCSTLEPLTKAQQQRIKAAAAAAAAGGSGGKKRASGKGKKAASAATSGAAAGTPASRGPAAAAAATEAVVGSAKPGGGGGDGSQVVGICLLPVFFSEAQGRGIPARSCYWAPLAAGVWGGTEVPGKAAAQGRDVTRQLLANEQGAIIAFNMQGKLCRLSWVRWRVQ